MPLYSGQCLIVFHGISLFESARPTRTSRRANGAEDDGVADQAGEQGKFQTKMNEIVAFAE